MPRRASVFVAGATYHVYCRTARGEAVFAEPAEAGDLVEVIREVKREHGLSVLAWCVMATHYHLAVRTDRQPLWRSMRLVQGRFARRHNRRQRTFGPFWQGRHKAIVVADERYLRQLLAYIHLNPVVAGAASDPARYRWSGHRELLGPDAGARHRASAGGESVPRTPVGPRGAPGRGRCERVTQEGEMVIPGTDSARLRAFAADPLDDRPITLDRPRPLA